MKNFKLLITIAAGAAFVGCLPTASAQTASGVLDLSGCGGGGIQVTLAAIFFVQNSSADHGCAITGAATNLTVAGLGTVGPNLTGQVLNLNVSDCSFFTIPGCTIPDFITFESLSSLHFDLSLIGPGPHTANCSNNFDQYEINCGVFTGAQLMVAHDSPFILIASTTGTSANLPLFGQVRMNNTVVGSFIGTLSTQQVGVSTAAFQKFILTGGTQMSTYSLSLLVIPAPTINAGGVVNAGSSQGTSVAPGEIVTIYGSNLSPVNSGLQLLPIGVVSPLTAVVSPLGAGTEVLFDGNPAPLIYTSPTQISAVAPYEITSSTKVQVLQSLVVGSNVVTLPVAATAPGIFTVNGGGTGQINMANQNGTLNSASAPAPKGSTVTFYATGEGATSPAGIDGVPTSVLTKPVAPVTLTIGGVTATAVVAEAPGAVAGVLQINATVPSTVASGSAVPVVLTIGGVAAQTGVTMSVQ
jgi:uncharacterized protein (TIGR03437 family)